MGLCCSKQKKTPKKDIEAPEASVGLLNEKDAKIKVDEVDPEHVTFEPFEQRGVLHLEDKTSLVGMAVLGPNIYVLSRSPSTISIYKKEERFEKVDEVTLKDIDAPWDMVASPKSERLYITDSSTNNIFVMEIPSNEVKSWLSDITYPHTLSITDPDEHVLVVKNGNPSMLELFDHEGQLVKRIELPDRIEYPKHAVRISTGNFFVSGKTKGEESWRVFEVSAEGEVQRETAESLAECYHLGTSSESTVMVADCWKNRILFFGPELKQSHELKLETKWPWRIQYLKPENLLYVLTGERPREEIGIKNEEKSDAEKVKNEEKSDAEKVKNEEKSDAEKEKEVIEKTEHTEKVIGAVCIYSIRETAKP